jgi:limonene-1,2-epoxide hydrolase
MEAAESRQALNVDTVAALWSKSYNTEGKPDWSHIYPYYHPQVVFQDSIQRIEGKVDFIAMCERLTERCEQLHMDVHSVAQEGNAIFLQWTMTMSFRKFPSTPIYGCTKLTLHEDGRIVEQRDYFHRPYRRFMQKKFG